MSGATFTDRELDIMAVLWELGSATVSDVRDRITDPLAYTTVQTVLRILEEKGHVGHEEDGRFHRYFPLVDRTQAGKGALHRVLSKIFSGSPELLMTHLLQERKLSPEELRRIKGILDSQLGEEDE